MSLKQEPIERFLIDCRRTEDKVITLIIPDTPTTQCSGPITTGRKCMQLQRQHGKSAGEPVNIGFTSDWLRKGRKVL